MEYEISLLRINYNLFLCLTENEIEIPKIEKKTFQKYIEIKNLVNIWYRDLNDDYKSNIIKLILRGDYGDYFRYNRLSINHLYKNF